MDTNSYSIYYAAMEVFMWHTICDREYKVGLNELSEKTIASYKNFADKMKRKRWRLSDGVTVYRMVSWIKLKKFQNKRRCLKKTDQAQVELAHIGFRTIVQFFLVV